MDAGEQEDGGDLKKCANPGPSQINFDKLPIKIISNRKQNQGKRNKFINKMKETKTNAKTICRNI